MRVVLIAIGLILAGLVPMAANAAPVRTFDTPKALLDYAYAPYATGKFLDDNELLYSKSLNALFAADAEQTPAGDVGAIDFDVFVNGQDYQLSELAIGDPMPEEGGVSVPVTLKNFDTPQSLVFHMVKENGGWKINDIESLTEGYSWRLTVLLADDPTLN